MRPAARPQVLAAARSLCTANDYQATLNLPRTNFPMRADAVSREPKIRQNVMTGLYDRQRKELRQKDGGGPAFILHDGPPFANGQPHIGHAVNKILKDMMCRYKMMRGDAVSFVPGWDCHGLPIELLADRVRRGNTFDSPEEAAKAVRAKARSIAQGAIAEQREAFQQWGVLADWENPYMTMDPSYEAAQLALFAEMHEQGLIVQGFKPVFWSPSSRSALAEAELEYHDHVSQAVYVRFPLAPGGELAGQLSRLGAERAAALSWTTTPWTLPANRALAINPRLDYVLAEVAASNGESEWVVCCKDLLPTVLEKCGLTCSAQEPVAAAALLESGYLPVLGVAGGDEGPRPILDANYVTKETGTGIVHTAPAHGVEDFGTCTRHGVEIGASMVDGAGRFTSFAGAALEGRNVLTDGNATVIDSLTDEGVLVHHESYEHRYPYDWRTRKPVILRATEQWFVDLTPVMRDAMDALEDVKMIPVSGKDRLKGMLGTRSDWCISRQRSWGVPIPVFYDIDTGEALMTQETMKHVVDLVREHGTDCWWSLSTKELLPPSLAETSNRYRRGYDTMDVWFDSGSSWRAVVQEREGSQATADVYLEGSDQHRGWFQSSLLTSVVSQRSAVAPYHCVVTHGFVVDGNGHKMSKSLKNGVDPRVVIEGGKNLKREPAYGTDLLRTWVASSTYTNDISIGPEILKLTFEHLRRIRNTGRFLLGNLSDFDIDRDEVLLEKMTELDRFVLHALAQTIDEATLAYDNHQFGKATAAVNTFVNQYLNGFFFEVAKDRLYLENAASVTRRSPQTVMHYALEAMTRLIAPFAVHLAEELHSFRRGVDPSKEASSSVLLEGWTEPRAGWVDTEMATRWEDVRALRRLVFRAIEDAKVAEVVKSGSEAEIHLVVPTTVLETLKNTGIMPPDAVTDTTAGECLNYSLTDVFLCAEIRVNEDKVEQGCHVFAEDNFRGHGSIEVQVSKTEQFKCPRCWRHICHTSMDLCPRCTTVLHDGNSQAP